MNNLLDTSILIYFLNGDKELNKHFIDIIQDSESNNFVSIASIWEISIKISIGKLVMKIPFIHLERALKENRFKILPITFMDTFILSTLSLYHRDPFDRIIISQAVSRKMRILSEDKAFNIYDVEIFLS